IKGLHYGRGIVRFAACDNNKYSVEARAAGRPVEVRALADRVEIRLDGEVVGSHARDFRRNRVAYDVRHYIPVLERKPGAIRNGAPFRAEHLPAPLARVRERLDGRENGGADMVRILLGARDHGLEAVAAACAEALAAGVCNADVILNILSRRCQPSPVGDVATPAGLELRSEPAADCARYDMLLDGRMSG
ncbi:MAG: IS21 family transposase, partial [Deltaproteobacteria bacterium]|nr:IS21 family transposase [Deltaproteobacteria bacterium]